ncbi:uncharacterized protein pdzph1 [Alosa sapidissima]|uniref:uncharacterized protein pdzph1 n=1 Tax=Alosa sapidissima TaxID=34773 RepID=UPI001C07FC88|nr:uncharacterized protein pdzph1 [Alosa sapidissima]
MSRRRRRNSRRKSSSGSKQTISVYNFQKHTKSPIDDVELRGEHAEKGETDSLHKENSFSKSDAEEEKEEDTETACSEKRFRRDSTVGCLNGNTRSQANILSGDTTSQQDQGVRITTSVTIDNLEQNTSQIVFQRSHGSGAVGSGNSTIAVTTTKLKGINANMKIEIREVLQLDDSDYKTTFILQSQRAKDTEDSSETQQFGCHIPSNESFTFAYPWSQRTINDSKIGKPFENMSCEFSVVEMSKEDADTSRNSVPTMCYSEDMDCYKSCCQDHCYGYGHCSHNDTDFSLVDGSSSRSALSDIWPLPNKLPLANSITSETELDVPPPIEFADKECKDDVYDLTEDVALCHISSASDDVYDQGESSSAMTFGATSSKRESTCHTSVDGGRSYDLSHSTSFEPESELDTEELYGWPNAPVSRTSFTKNFIYRHKQKGCMRNNSIAILENSSPPAGYLNKPMKRRKTFPAVVDESNDHQDRPMSRDSFSSDALSPFFMQSLPRQTELSGRFYPEDDPFYSFFSESRKSSKGSSNFSSSPVRTHNVFSPNHYACGLGTGNSFFGSDRDAMECERGEQELSVVEEANPESVVGCPQEHSEVAESGFDEDIIDIESTIENLSPIRSVLSKDPFIHITPPSPGSSRDSNIYSGYSVEQTKEPEDPEPYMEESMSDPKPWTQRKESAGDIQPKSRKGSVTTVMMVGSEQRILHSHSIDSITSERKHRELVCETPCLLPIQDAEQMEEDGAGETTQEGRLTPQKALVSESSISIQSSSPIPCEVADLQSDSNHSLRSANTSQEIETKEEAATDKQVEKRSQAKSQNKRSFHTPRRTMMQPSDTVRRHSSSKISSEVKELLKLPADLSHKDPEEAPDHWARRRKLFKESRQRSSAGGSSITSNITDESDTMFSEETRSVDMSMRDMEDRGFYTETFHCASWIYRGDDVSPSESPRCLSKRPRPVTIRERTVKITKGFGEYPWGFRIQFSKPIIVTEVDTNGAAEEAGLLVGDYVLAVNGTDVTSVPHSEAADLARQGPDLLTMVIGSDISRSPNTPRPACRGYLHKRTQSSLIKGWRRRWFVLRHDCCLYYYKHKRDEGKSQALSKMKLEGAEVEADSSLGKPFVFKCSPVSAGRVYYFCATSNQEMKRWLEAMSQAVQPLPQNHVWVDVTRHNSSLPPLAVKTPECLGLLHQLDRTKDVWMQNYCILKDGCLYLYASIRSTNALGGIYLHGYSVKEQPMGSKRSTIELRPPSEEFKTFHLCAENPTENKRWILALRATISKWVPLHRAIQDYMSKPPEETRM